MAESDAELVARLIRQRDEKIAELEAENARLKECTSIEGLEALLRAFRDTLKAKDDENASLRAALEHLADGIDAALNQGRIDEKAVSEEMQEARAALGGGDTHRCLICGWEGPSDDAGRHADEAHPDEGAVPMTGEAAPQSPEAD